MMVDYFDGKKDVLKEDRRIRRWVLPMLLCKDTLYQFLTVFTF